MDLGKFINDDQFFLKVYNDSFIRLYALNNPPCYKSNRRKSHTTEESVISASLSRTKREIRELCLCNDFEYFATITVNSQNADRFSLQACQDLLCKKLHKMRRKVRNTGKQKIKYLFITEKHKDGAFHFHGLISNLPDLYTNSNGYLSSRILDEIGFNSFSRIKSYNKCCNYITKYITKDCIKNEHNMIYMRSRNLKFADKYVLSKSPFEKISPKFRNEYVSISDFDLSTLSQSDKFSIYSFLQDYCK